MSESDYRDMTRNGALCNAAGEIGLREFESIMRGEVITYLQVGLARQRKWGREGETKGGGNKYWKKNGRD